MGKDKEVIILGVGILFGFILTSIFYYGTTHRTNNVNTINRTCETSNVRVCDDKQIQEGASDRKPQSDNKVYELHSTKTRRVTAYNVGDVSQSDNSPCKSANGENICMALALKYPRCGANFVPFGTKLIINGIGECLVTDRMHKRYPDDVDIAMPLNKKQEAKDFGVQYLEVSILYEVNKGPNNK